METGKISMVQKNGHSYVAHGKKHFFFAVKQKLGYLEHSNSDIESKKCVMKLRLRATQ
jgi:hypothetical protein